MNLILEDMLMEKQQKTLVLLVLKYQITEIYLTNLAVIQEQM